MIRIRTYIIGVALICLFAACDSNAGDKSAVEGVTASGGSAASGTGGSVSTGGSDISGTGGTISVNSIGTGGVVIQTSGGTGGAASSGEGEITAPSDAGLDGEAGGDGDVAIQAGTGAAGQLPTAGTAIAGAETGGTATDTAGTGGATGEAGSIAGSGGNGPITLDCPDQVRTGTPTNVFVIGDSTACIFSSTDPRTGWAQVLQQFFAIACATVQDKALSGRSSKSFYDEGSWTPVVAAIKTGDYLLIQFGHNDEKTEDPTRYTDPYTTYQQYLTKYIDESRAKGAIPILLTSIERNYWTNETIRESHGDYPLTPRKLHLA